MLLQKKLGAKATIARVRNYEYNNQIKNIMNDLDITMVINPEKETAAEILKVVNFPEAIRVDNFAEGNLGGCNIIRPCEVDKINFDYALITTHLGRFEAVDILKRMNKVIYKDWNYFISKDIPEENVTE